MISGKTILIGHLGYPTESFKAPLIYNPWFESKGIDAVVVPMGVRADDYPTFLRSLFRLTNIRGALVTMPHKVTTVGLVDEFTPTVEIAGSCNAVLLRPDGTLLGDMFDGVGSAIAASLAADGAGAISLFDTGRASAEALAGRLAKHYPALDVRLATSDPVGYDLVVNGTPLGMKAGDPLPFDVSRLEPSTFVGEVVLKQEITPLLEAARARGCRYQVATDMLFEMIPAYLEFFGFGTATPDELRAVARVAQ